MKVSFDLDDRQTAALRLIARKESRAVAQYFRDAVFFLVRDRASRDGEVAEILGYTPPPLDAPVSPSDPNPSR